MTILVEPGEILRDRYIIREIIGRGGMGSIFLAEDNRLPGRLCAVKQVTHDQDLPDTMREQTKEQFYREASVLARLDHPNLPKVSDFFSAPDSDYLVMDFVPGDDLKALMDGARRKGEFLDQEEVLGWATQLADALAYLHGQDPPVIHRDIKPSNMKITPNQILKLVDFGLVKQMLPDEMTITIIQGRGTALYTPLEQYGGDTGHTDPRSDIYAFGATLYHLLTNQPPIEAKHRFINPDALRSLQELNPEVDPQVESAILWAMSLHPDERPQEITSFRESLINDHPIPGTVLQRPFNAKQIFDISTPDKVLVGIASLLLLLAVFGTIL